MDFSPSVPPRPSPNVDFVTPSPGIALTSEVDDAPMEEATTVHAGHYLHGDEAEDDSRVFLSVGRISEVFLI
jgi:hypothetical protein